MGPRLAERLLESHDDQLRCFLEGCLAGDLDEAAWEQASIGVQTGGLGFRRAARLCAVAFAASRIEARPFVDRIFQDMARQGIDTTHAAWRRSTARSPLHLTGL